MKKILIIALLAIGGTVYSQSNKLTGIITDEQKQPLGSTTVVLLNPADSTLRYFGVAGNNGQFEIKNIRKGQYLLQASLIGFTTYYRNISFPLETGDDIGTIVMSVKVYSMGEVTVSGERIPIRIKSDTIEYDAKAYTVKPDAVAEDLIKKLPGIEVDRSGNITAMGEDVNKVLVDGKEFFSSDPKLATRNLPANAIARIQLYDKQSDESEFTGIDDGERDPTINIVLENDKRRGVFGEVSAAGGTGEHAAATAKVYHFSNKTQIAGLGMFNNINQYGFSMRDFIAGNNGSSSSGQSSNGTGSNGAAGLNFSVFNSRHDRFFVSYTGSGSKRNIDEISKTWNYLTDGTYLVDLSQDQVKRDTSDNLTFGLRKRIGENHNIIVNGGLSYNSASNPLSSYTQSYLDDELVNILDRSTDEAKSGLSGNLNASYMYKINEGKTILGVSGKASYSGSNSKSEFSNLLEYQNPYELEETNQFYDLNSETGSYSGGLSLTQKITSLSSLDVSFNTGISTDDLKRRQGDLTADRTPDEFLSPDFLKTDSYINPGLTWKRSTTKSKLLLSLNATIGNFNTILNDDEGQTTKYSFLTPRARWEYEYKSGRRLMVDVSSSVNTPQASQLLPVVNNTNSLSLSYGNRDLLPEYKHTARVTWWLFDQFSFTTLLTGVNMTYTHNKIGYDTEVDEELQRTSTPINTDNGWNAGGNVSLSTPIKSIGIKIGLNLAEGYDCSSDIINGTENINRSLTHKISLTVDNRKKDKWDIETGGSFSLTGSRYSVQSSLNNKYYNMSWFGDVRFTPNKHFSFATSANITNYASKSFDDSQLIPLLGAEANYYFMKNQRASLVLTGVDLLNRDTGLVRKSEMNSLSETETNVIGRYVLLSFKYRLNKVGNTGSGGGGRSGGGMGPSFTR